MSAKQEAFRIFMSMRTEICLLHDSELLKDKIAKQCALIAVDEMLKQHKKITVSHIVSAYKTIQDFNENLTNVQNELDSYVLQNYGYWQDVKQEIQLL
jgi:hypothetical protein